MTVKESLGPVIAQKGFVDGFASYRNAHRHVTRRESLRQTDDIRAYLGVFASKHLRSPAKTGEDLIRDHQCSVAIAELSYSRQELRRPHDHPSGSLQHWFDQH